MLNLKKLSTLFGYGLLTVSLFFIVACGDGMDEQKMLLKAKEHISQGDLKAASFELKNTLQKNNKNFEARYLLATISMKVGDYATAMKEFTRALDGGWDKEQIQPSVAHILLAQKEFQKLLDEITVNDSWSAESRANIIATRALAEAGLGHTALAKNTLKQGTDIKSDALIVLKATTMFELAKILDGDGSSTLDKALAIYPENIELMFIRATIDQNNKELSKAGDLYKKIISLDPPNITTPFSQKASIGLVRIELSKGNNAEADIILERLLTKNENDTEALYLSGLSAFNAQNHSEAEKQLRKLLTINSNHPLANQLMGKIKYLSKDYEQAEQHFSEYLKAAPNDITTHKILAQTYINHKQPEKARLIVNSLLAHDPNDDIALRLKSQLQFYKGDTAAGIESLQQALILNPEDLALRGQLIKAYIANGQTEQAINEIELFQSQSANSEEAQKLRITAYVQANEFDTAIVIINKMLEQKPDNPDYLALAGSLQDKKGNTKQARDYYNKALTLHKNHLNATAGLARLELQNDNIDAAVSLYRGLASANVGGVFPMLALVELAEKQNRTADMLSWLEKARSTSPNEVKSRAILGNYYLLVNQVNKANIYLQEALKVAAKNVEILLLQGRVLIAQKRYRESLPPLKQLAKKLPDPTIAKTLLGEAYIRLGMIDEALIVLRESVNLQPKNYLAISLLAGSELKAGNFDNSIEYAKILQKDQSNLPVGYLHEGDALLAQENYNEAISAYNKAWGILQSSELAIRIFSANNLNGNFSAAIKPINIWLQKTPQDATTRLFLAAQYQSAGKNEKAITEYENVVKQEPENSPALNNLAWLYSLKGDAKALDTAERAYRSAPENAGIQDTYGWILIQQDQAEKGKRMIELALKTAPGNAEIRYHYAASLIKTGNPDEGRRILEELLSQAESFHDKDEARELLNSL